MNYMHVSAGYRSMAYYAGRAWLEEFNKTDHPLTAQTINMTFREVMPLICSDYSQEEYDEFEAMHIAPDDEERLLSQMTDSISIFSRLCPILRAQPFCLKKLNYRK